VRGRTIIANTEVTMAAQSAVEVAVEAGSSRQTVSGFHMPSLSARSRVRREPTVLHPVREQFRLRPGCQTDSDRKQHHRAGARARQSMPATTGRRSRYDGPEPRRARSPSHAVEYLLRPGRRRHRKRQDPVVRCLPCSRRREDENALQNAGCTQPQNASFRKDTSGEGHRA
jgi:hypothetical protein